MEMNQEKQWFFPISSCQKGDFVAASQPASLVSFHIMNQAHTHIPNKQRQHVFLNKLMHPKTSWTIFKTEKKERKKKVMHPSEQNASHQQAIWAAAFIPLNWHGMLVVGWLLHMQKNSLWVLSHFGTLRGGASRDGGGQNTSNVELRWTLQQTLWLQPMVTGKAHGRRLVLGWLVPAGGEGGEGWDKLWWWWL